jgi:hypothetical protein
MMSAKEQDASNGVKLRAVSGMIPVGRRGR